MSTACALLRLAFAAGTARAVRTPRVALILGLLVTGPIFTGSVLASRPAAAQSLAPAVDTAAAVRWNVLARQLWAAADARRRAAQAAAGDSTALRALPGPSAQGRAMTLLAVAQYDASATAAPGARATAVADASAAVLEPLFPDSASRSAIGRALARDHGTVRFAAGASPGARAAAWLLAWAAGDRHDARWTGAVPTGPGMWRGAPGVAPGSAALTLLRPWTLDSASQFRPVPPPAYGSPAFDSALAEVRRATRTRTAEQAAVARRWAMRQPPEYWNGVAVRALVAARVPEAEAARALALVNVALQDAIVACWDAKYHYWLLRPSQADSSIAFPDGVALPNFPAYPSGHACSAGAVAEVMGRLVPAARAEVEEVAAECAVSRLYAGVHYRFDNDVGLALGRRVARHVLAADARGLFGRAAAWHTAGSAAPRR